MSQPQTQSVPNLPPGIRVMLVDDQAMIGEAVRRMLASEEDIEYRYCDNPLEAIDIAQDWQPTVILQDLVMPDVDGLDLVRDYRQDDATALVPIVVLSSREEAATKAEAFARGANDYLVKLPDPVEIIARIRHHSDGYTARLERDAAHLALEENEAHLREELSKAARYVQSLLPEPMDDRVQTDWRFIPSVSLGGDAFGYHWLDEHRLALYLLDVCGHGVGPALLSITAMNVISKESLPGVDFANPGAVLSELNNRFQMQDHQGMFFTIWYGVYDDEKKTLDWSGGGHPPAVLMDKQADHPVLLDSDGPMVGAVTGLDFETRTCEVPSGSRLVLYSDGIYEIKKPDGSLWTLDEFVDLVASQPAHNVSSVDAIIGSVRAISGQELFEDDCSVVEFAFA
ncbi:MAG: fused response regulator/phosphatase [Planctomycetota bacterium]|nr:fused response regulator/phosphatase [Planctomycetota bacterium]